MNKGKSALDKLTDAIGDGAFWIEFFVVVSGVLQWAIASMAADGFTIPSDWSFVHYASGIFGASMAIIEGFAIAYVFKALSTNRNKPLIVLSILMSVSLVFVIAPSTYARALGKEISEVVSNNLLWIWSTSIIASRMFTVASVAWASASKNDVAISNKLHSHYKAMLDKIESQKQAEVDKLTEDVNASQDEIASLRKWGVELQEQVASLRNTQEQKNDNVNSANSIIDTSTQGQTTVEKIIEMYRSQPALSQTVVAEQVGTSRQNVSNHLNRLEKEGKIRRNGNRRVYILDGENNNG